MENNSENINKDMFTVRKGEKLYALFDSGGQGMRDNGLLGVFTTRKEAENIRGNSWCSIFEIDANKFYGDGVTSECINQLI